MCYHSGLVGAQLVLYIYALGVGRSTPFTPIGKELIVISTLGGPMKFALILVSLNVIGAFDMQRLVDRVCCKPLIRVTQENPR